MTLQKFSNTTEKSYINKTLILYLFVHLQKAPLKCQCNNIANYMYDHCTNIFLIQHQNLFNNAHTGNCSSSELIKWDLPVLLFGGFRNFQASLPHFGVGRCNLGNGLILLGSLLSLFSEKAGIEKNYFSLRFFCIIHIWLFIIPQKIGLILVYILAL